MIKFTKIFSMTQEKLRAIGYNGIKTSNQTTNKVITLLFCLFIFAYTVFNTRGNTNHPLTQKQAKMEGKHYCNDITHFTCDGANGCSCDGLGCSVSDYNLKFEKLKLIYPRFDSLQIDVVIKSQN